MNVVLSGNFMDVVEADYLEHTRVQVGLGGENVEDYMAWAGWTAF